MTDLTIENDESSFHRELHNDDDAITAQIQQNKLFSNIYKYKPSYTTPVTQSPIIYQLCYLFTETNYIFIKKQRLLHP